jgi:hypothetical protein
MSLQAQKTNDKMDYFIANRFLCGEKLTNFCYLDDFAKPIYYFLIITAKNDYAQIFHTKIDCLFQKRRKVIILC